MMRAKDTLYRNHLFRSRLEAKYAVFFDALNEQWEYEKEGYDLDDGDHYLPDFYLPRIRMFVEIKPTWPNAKEVRKCRKLQFFTERDVAICYGLPLENEAIHFGWSENDGGKFTEEFHQWSIDDGFLTLNGGSMSQEILDAALRATTARFEFGQTPEIATSRPLRNTVNYDDIAF